MKTKKIQKKLTFNKKTVSQLTDDRLNEVKGGITNTCISIYPDVCTIGCPASWEVKTACVWCVP